MPREVLFSSAGASCPICVRVHVNARCLFKIKHMDEPRPANQVATESFERGVPPSRRCCHQSADLLARELAVWLVNAEVVASGRCCSKRRLRLLHQRPIVDCAVDRFPPCADGIAPLSSMERISSSTCRGPPRTLHLEGKSSAPDSGCTARDDLPSHIPGALSSK